MQTRTIVLKRGDIFILSDASGQIGPAIPGAGLYFLDTRHLSHYSFTVNGQAMELLDCSAEHSNVSVGQFANPLLHDAADVDVLPHTIGIRWFREIEGGMHEQFDLHNFNEFAIDLTFEVRFAAEFRDIFDIRGFRTTERGEIQPPTFDGQEAVLSYRARDGAEPRTVIHFNRPPDSVTIGTKPGATLNPAEAGTLIPGHDRLAARPPTDQPALLVVRFVLHLDPQAGDRIALTIKPELRTAEGMAQQPAFPLQFDDPLAPHEHFAAVSTDNDLLNRVLDRSLRDMQSLITPFPGGRLAAAGVPWYVAPFGRDSLIVALQMLMFSPDLAVETLRFLARQQGSKRDDWTEEEPGKILHEQRFGEMARTSAVPHTPYYGTVDATPLFVILFAEAMRWTGDPALFAELYPHVERAMDWIDRCGDSDGDGFVDYGRRSREGLVNQGWKDSDNSLQFPDRSPVVAPVALVEVQAYVAMARRGLAEVLDRFGSAERAQALRAQADEECTRFEAAFWSEPDGFYGQAIDGSGRLVRAISSNPGHCLFAGTVRPDRAAAVAGRLLAPDLFSGWGIRTLSSEMPSYNPMSYHNGSVWPHDNGLIAAGLRGYGFDEAAARLMSGLLEAANHFDYLRLPELFCGFSRDFERYSSPVSYPVSCSPQAWAAGAMPHLLQIMLGLEPDAVNHRLRLRPYLPDWLSAIRVRGLRLAGERLDLLVRGHRHDVEVEFESPGELAVEVVSGPSRNTPEHHSGLNH